MLWASPEIRKKNTKKSRNPRPRVGPRKYEKKKKKNTEKIQKRSFSGHFRIFSVFFSYFWGPTRGGGFRDFSVFFSYFRAWGVLSSIPGTRNRNLRRGHSILRRRLEGTLEGRNTPFSQSTTPSACTCVLGRTPTGACNNAPFSEGFLDSKKGSRDCFREGSKKGS